MARKNPLLWLGVLALGGALTFLLWNHRRASGDGQVDVQTMVAGAQAADEEPLISGGEIPQLTNGRRTEPTIPANPTGIKRRLSEFSQDEAAAFRSNFLTKYKPAILRWMQAYEGHVPFTAGDIGPERCVERVGLGASYYEYVFVFNGITLGVGEVNGTAKVRYLNVANATAQLMTIRSNSPTPSLQSPVARPDVHRMLRADSGSEWSEAELTLIPTGISGGMNGGINVIAGGDVNDFITWKYHLVFGPDGNLAYYLRGATADVK